MRNADSLNSVIGVLLSSPYQHRHIPKPLHLPLPAKPRQAGLAGEELLHGGLFEVALLGDELVELGEQGIHIRQRGGDGALFGERVLGLSIGGSQEMKL